MIGSAPNATTPAKARPIYSVRTQLGREVWWSTGRKAALEWAALRNRMGGNEWEKDGPLEVYRASLLRPDAVRATRRTA